MITIATSNPAVSPAIHSPGPRLSPKSSLTSYITQLGHKLRPFYAKQTQFPKVIIHLTAHPRLIYAKQTQFPKSQNEPNCLWNKELSKYTPSRTAKKQTQFPHRRSQFIPTRRQPAGPGFCPFVSSLLIFLLRICFGFRYSCFGLQPNNYAKQQNIPPCQSLQNKPNFEPTGKHHHKKLMQSAIPWL